MFFFEINHATSQKKKKEKKEIMQPLQIGFGPSTCIGRESWCLPCAGFFGLILDISQ